MSQASAATSDVELCANCGGELAGTHCQHCGQHRRESQRLEVRQILTRFVENLYDFDSAFLRTWLGLTRRPGTVCREYVQGRRKTYMNPFGYFVLAITVNVILTTVFSKLFPDPPGVAEESSDFDSTLMLLILVPLAMIWCKIFRREGFNLAENYVFALYVLGHFVWIEMLLLTPASLVVSELFLTILYCLVAAIYVTPAATAFYREHIGIVFGKLLLSVILMAVVVMLIGAIEFWIGLINAKG
jgi:hypothetical protein